MQVRARNTVARLVKSASEEMTAILAVMVGTHALVKPIRDWELTWLGLILTVAGFIRLLGLFGKIEWFRWIGGLLACAAWALAAFVASMVEPEGVAHVCFALFAFANIPLTLPPSLRWDPPL